MIHRVVEPRVSVIIPSYNRKTLLSRALPILLAQTEQDFEIIVVDDASTDGTKEWLKEMYTDERIRYERLSHNSGVHIARNTGLGLAPGGPMGFPVSEKELPPGA